MSPTRSIDMQSEGSRSDSSVRSDHWGRTPVLATDAEKLLARQEIDRLIKSMNIKKIKPKVKQITWFDRIRHRSVTKRGTVNYLTDGVKRKTLPCKGYMKSTEKWKAKENIRERLQVESEPDPVGLLDTIPDFFSIVHGRPVKERFRKREFIKQSRYRLLKNIDQGFMCDTIKRIEDQQQIQSTVLENAVQESRDMRKLMDLFLADQQKIAVKLEENLRKVRDEREEKDLELKEILKKIGNVRDLIHKRSVDIDKAMQYKNFLHEISSREWLENYEKEKEDWKKETENDVKELIQKVIRYKESCENDPSMDDVIVKFINEYENCGPVKIEFENVDQVVEVLMGMYQANLEKATMLADLKAMAAPVVIDGRSIKTKYIKCKKKIVKAVEKAAKDLSDKKDSQLRLYSIYKDTKRLCKQIIVSKQALKDLALLKEFYGEITGNNSDYMSEEEMWRQIDEIYTDLKEKVKDIPEKELKKKYKDMRTKQEDMMNDAVKAKDRVMQIESVIRGIRKSYEKPSIPPAKKPVLPRSLPPPTPPSSASPPSSPGVSYEQDLNEEQNLYFPIKHLKEMYDADLKKTKSTLKLEDDEDDDTLAKKKSSKDDEEKERMVDEEMKRFMYADFSDDSSSTSSISSSDDSNIDLTFMDPSLKLERTDPAIEYIVKELETLSTVTKFEDFLAIKKQADEEEEEAMQNIV